MNLFVRSSRLVVPRRSRRNGRYGGGAEARKDGLGRSGVCNVNIRLGTRQIHDQINHESWRADRFDFPTHYVAVEGEPESFDRTYSCAAMGDEVNRRRALVEHLGLPDVTDRHRCGSPNIRRCSP
jgi:hypothetical protein